MSDFHYEEEDFSSQFNGGTLIRILQQARPHWKWVAGFVVAVALVSFLDAFFTYLNKLIIDEGILAADRDRLVGLIVVYAAMIFLQAAAVFAFIYLCGILGQRVMYDLRKKVFNHLQNLSFSYFDRTPVGWIMSRVGSDTERMADLITWNMLDIVWSVTNIVMALIFMATIHWQLTLVVLLLIPVLVVVAVWFKTKILVEYRKARKLNSKITGTYNENITGVRVVKALNRESANLKEFDGLTSDMYRAGYRAAWLSALFLPVVQLLSAVAVGAVVWFGGLETQVGGITIGGIQAFIAYITFMMWPVQEMARVYAEMQQAVASAERFFSLLDSKPEVVDRPGAVEADTMRGTIEFDNVTFYYQPEKPVLTNFNLTVKAGETIALVGPTGGGKSTIVNLLSRFYEPKAGVIRLNGRDYTEYTLHAIHARLGVVLQTPHLFSGTIRENIRYGRLDATDAEIEEAARLAGAHEFITALEHGYDEPVGEGGVLLSVGQKQLISLARAILAQPDIFIMDEATSSVDTLTEALIQQGMENVMKNSTSFVIAHRLSTIRRADRILVIENGGISEMGSHAELMRQKGHYYNLYMTQFRQALEQQYDPFANGAHANGHSANGHQAEENVA
ncbi:MAG: ABC transporter ATP-binding protein [Chloroflexi bacterium]|nr:ABC transporter ATP-binding protein [Chloroflexota bacterium]MDL1885830.1 ABC transporter ATP-binding protein [Anaerolineae bacterium CFX8]